MSGLSRHGLNLSGQEIVNMRMARYAGSPALLAGDIDPYLDAGLLERIVGLEGR